MAQTWTGAGNRFRIEWGGQIWVLDLDQKSPALQPESHGSGRLLGLSEVADVGRSDPSAFVPGTLISVEHHQDRLEATYLPRDWSGLMVRGVWKPAGEHAIDLTVHLQADSVDCLHSLEVEVLSTFTNTPSRTWTIEPRDPEALARAGDGRESTAEFPQVKSPFGRDQLAPWKETVGNSTYVEFCHSQDLSRRMNATSSVRSALFGHPLEKGVVIRGRLRGLWLPGKPGIAELESCQREFLAQPLPLGV